MEEHDEKKLLITLILVCMVLSACSDESGQVTAKENYSEDISTDLTRRDPSMTEYSDLSTFCYQIFANSLDETNPVLSPVSAYIALAMVTDGARGDTQTELLNVLGDGYRDISGTVISSFPDEQKTGQILMM